jgi:hypothetical protein
MARLMRRLKMTQTPREVLEATADLAKARAFALTTQCETDKIFDMLCHIRDDINAGFEKYREAKAAEQQAEIERLRAAKAE